MPTEFHAAFDLPATAAGLRLDQALARALPQHSRSRLQGWVRSGAVQLDGRAPRTVREIVHGGERVLIAATLPLDESVAAQEMDLDVVHADDALIVVNKPVGLVVHPGAGNPAGTLQNALLAFDPALAHVPRAGLVHRIDKDTSGLIAVARTVEAHTALTRALRARHIAREYLAVCVGRLTAGGTIEQPIGRDRRQRTRMAVRGDGRAAVTHYRIAQRFRAHTLLRVALETGRTHQIRVHLAHLGHPLVGDPLYGGRRQAVRGATEELRATLAAFRRQALHAARLALAHPVTGQALDLQAPPPADFAALVEALARDARAEGRGEDERG